MYRGLIAAGAQVRWCDAPRELALELDANAPDPPGLALMRGLKQSLDPGGVFPAGCCHGRL